MNWPHILDILHGEMASGIVLSSLARLVLAALLGGLIGLDVVSFPQAMISRPIVAATLAGAFVGNAAAGALIGVVLELIALDARGTLWGGLTLGKSVKKFVKR